MQLRRGLSVQNYSVVFEPTSALADIIGSGGSELPVFVFRPFIGPRAAQVLRQADVQYLDEAGNASIAFGDVLIDVQGQKRTHAGKRTSMTGNLFSAARARVVFALICKPDLWTGSQRELGRASGVSLGQVHQTLRLLADAGFDRHLTSDRHADLLDLWAAAFPLGLARGLALRSFHGDPDVGNLIAGQSAIYLSGEGAAEDLLRPATLQIYVDDFDPDIAIANRWRADGPQNIHLLQKFWHFLDKDVPARSVQIAPWPLVYADLRSADDPRVIAAAAAWKALHRGL